MTKAEYAQFPEFAGLEVFDENDKKGCESIERPLDPSFDGIREAHTTDHPREFLADSALVPKGTIESTDGTHFVVIFWIRR